MAWRGSTVVGAVVSLGATLNACAAGGGAGGERAPLEARYRVVLDERRPDMAEIALDLPADTSALTAARDGDGASLLDVRCADGRPSIRTAAGWAVPPGCRRMRWRARLQPIDAAGLDASLPVGAFSVEHRYWVVPERDSFLRAAAAAGSASVSLRLANGSTVERRYQFPSNTQPPFYAVVGADPTVEYQREGVGLRVFGAPPAFPWMNAVHGDVLTTWARWHSDLVRGGAPASIDWAWVRPTEALEPGYNASAGAEAIISQIKLRPGDPDGEAKARAVIATSAAHEGFHSITGAAGQAWPAWVNESLANHFAIEAARAFLAPSDFRFVELFYIEPDVRTPLLEAQAGYAAGDGEQAGIFYVHGARFWRAIERVLDGPAGGSGKLAALIKASDNLAGVDLHDADSLAAFLDRHSSDRAGPIVRCYLLGSDCPPADQDRRAS